MNLTLGQTHFIELVDAAQVALVTAVRSMKFGSVFCESLVRWSGNNADAIEVYW